MKPRRLFLSWLGGSGAALLHGQSSASTQPPAAANALLPLYARRQQHTALKQSSFDRTGGNADFWHIGPHESRTVFEADGPGIISHIWFTIAAQSPRHLKEVVLRIFWEGNEKPSVEVPVGDFFGLNLGDYFLYQSIFLNCSSVKALNCYFAMPFRHAARIAVTNDGERPIGSFYSNIDYMRVPSLPDDICYFHAQYRQAVPTSALHYASQQEEKNLNGNANYLFCESAGQGHFMGVTLGVIQNADNWFGEGDEMVFVDDLQSPVITGTGTEDYFCGAWDFGGRDTAVPFANLYNGAPYIAAPERTGGRYCLYRWHADNPIAFRRSIRFTIEHGHANNRSDSYFSTAYWYQSEPFTAFPRLPGVLERLPQLHMTP